MSVKSARWHADTRYSATCGNPCCTEPANQCGGKVFATSRAPDTFKPWAKQSPQESTGSGVVISGNRILTDARVVSYASVVQVNGTPVPSLAHLVALLRDMQDQFVTFVADSRGGETLVLPQQEMVAAVEDILSGHGVRSQGSLALMGKWQGKTGQ